MGGRIGSDDGPVEVAGWTLVSNRRELTRWEKRETVSYCLAPVSFPCFVRQILASDENGQTDVLYLGDVRDMVLALELARPKAMKSG